MLRRIPRPTCGTVRILLILKAILRAQVGIQSTSLVLVITHERG